MGVDGNNEEALYTYASIFYDGEGLNINKPEAARYFKMSTDNGNTNSIHVNSNMVQIVTFQKQLDTAKFLQIMEI